MAVPPAQNLLLAEYEWILVLGSFAAFIFGFGTGSNDVANAFGTSVGSKTLSLFKAVLIAIVFEFTGALVLGRVSQETISGGIADIGAFTTEPEFYAYGMMWALLFGGVWQILASMNEMNVSATHTIIGAIVGFSMVFKGRGAVIWAQPQIVCTGPLTAINPCNYEANPAGCNNYDAQKKQMYFVNPFGTPDAVAGIIPNVPLAGAYIVGLDQLVGPDGSNLCTFNASILSALLNANITNGGAILNATWPGALPAGRSTSTSAGSFSTIGGCTNGASKGPYIYNGLTSNYGEVQFTLRTATWDGKAIECTDALTCPRNPDESPPVVPGQFLYKSTAGYCTTTSNAPTPFPPYKGVLIIVLSWFFSPTLTALASATLFGGFRFFVLRSPSAYKLSFAVLPFLAFLTFWVNIYFVLTKGAAKLLSKEAEGWTLNKAAWISAAAAGGVSFGCAFIAVPLMYTRINTIFELREKEEAEKKADAEKGEVVDASKPEDNPLVRYMKSALKMATSGMTVDLHAVVEEDPLIAAIHANAEVFDQKAEAVFAYMQVFSAICVIFAHGAGEVGYMSGPLGAIFQIIRSGNLPDKSSPPIWTVIIGALGLVIGLGTYGYQVTRAVGVQLAKLTPSRGFSAEISTAMIIMIAAQYGLPTSSSQCITGGIIGIACLEGRKGLNLKFLLKTFSSWIWTMLFVALIVGGLFAQGAFAPSVQMGAQLRSYEEGLSVRANVLLTNYRAMIQASGYGSTDTFITALTQTITNTAAGQYYNYAQNPPGYYPGNKAPNIQTVKAFQMLGYIDVALGLWQQSISPNTASGLNMCNGQQTQANAANGTYTTNWKPSNYNATLDTVKGFPWSYTAASTPLQFSAMYSANNPIALDGLRRNFTNQWAKSGSVVTGPCTGSVGSPKVSLTNLNVLIPGPGLAYENRWLDTLGRAIDPEMDPDNYMGWQVDPAQIVGVTTRWGVANPDKKKLYGNVTLDTTINFKTCQRAPCNQRINIGGWAYNG